VLSGKNSIFVFPEPTEAPNIPKTTNNNTKVPTANNTAVFPLSIFVNVRSYQFSTTVNIRVWKNVDIGAKAKR